MSNPLKIAKIAIEYENQNTCRKNKEFFEFDQSLDLSEIIEAFCNQLSLKQPQNYALKFAGKTDKDDRYVTLDNKFDVKDGSILKLKESPGIEVSKMCKIVKNATLVEKKQIFEKLYYFSFDPVFVKEFLDHKDGLDCVIKILSEERYTGDLFNYALLSFKEICNHDSFEWNSVTEPCVNRLIKILHTPNSSSDTLNSVLSILESMTLFCDKFLETIQKCVEFLELYQMLQVYKIPETQKNVLALINALISKRNHKEKIVFSKSFANKPYREFVYEVYSNLDGDIGSEMACQLADYLGNTLYFLQSRSHTIIKMEDSENSILARLTKAAFGSVSPENYERLMFKNLQDPIQDFMEYPGMLLTDCLNYLESSYYKGQFVSMMKENFFRLEIYRFPFGQASTELIKVLLKILQIDDSDGSRRQFHPMLLKSNNPFEETFCICIFSFYKIWKEVKAKYEDIDKIVNTVRDLIVHVLKTSPPDFQVFTETLNSIDSKKVREENRVSHGNLETNCPAVNALKEDIVIPEIEAMIKEERLKYLESGLKFEVFKKGTRIRNKFWFACLSKDRKSILYGDCNEEQLPSEENFKNIPVNDIKQLLIEYDCPHYREVKNKSQGSFLFSIGYDSPNGRQECLNFVVYDEKHLNYWIDGISFLINQNTKSKQFTDDFEMLVSAEMKFRTLELYDLNLCTLHLQNTPEVPELPEDYDFYYENDVTKLTPRKREQKKRLPVKSLP